MISLVLGGTRSGKSVVAERLAAAAGPPVTYVATARLSAGDHDHARRIRAHQLRRPTSWVTVDGDEVDHLAGLLRRLDGTVLVDSLGTWVTRFPDLRPPTTEVDELVGALRSRAGDSIVVSEEVGLAPHAPTELGRAFVDALGSLNQVVGAVADRAMLVVAGRVLVLGPSPDGPPEPGGGC